MGLEDQAAVKRVADEHGSDVVVLLGTPDAESTQTLAQTVVAGDPSYAGPLAGVPLGLPVFHVFEPEVRDQVPGDVYEAQVALRSHPRRAARGAAGRGDDVMRRPSADDLGRAPAHAPRGHPRAVTAVAASDHQNDPVRA